MQTAVAAWAALGRISRRIIEVRPSSRPRARLGTLANKRFEPRPARERHPTRRRQWSPRASGGEDARDVRSGGSGGRRRLRRLLLAMGVLLPCSARRDMGRDDFGRGAPRQHPELSSVGSGGGRGSGSVGRSAFRRSSRCGIYIEFYACVSSSDSPSQARKGVLHVRYRSIAARISQSVSTHH